MVIFLAGFPSGQGALPASRRVFHAPLTGRETGETGATSQREGAFGEIAPDGLLCICVQGAARDG
jgi:hypothetical protein